MTCAVWYWHYGSPEFVLCEDEPAAASVAVGIEDRASWPAYEQRGREQEEAERRRDEERKAQPPPATRKVHLPFAPDRTTTVPADAPSWLGMETK